MTLKAIQPASELSPRFQKAGVGHCLGFNRQDGGLAESPGDMEMPSRAAGVRVHPCLSGS